MARYPKSNGFCKNHPEVKAMESRNICYDCYSEMMKKYAKIKKRIHNQTYYNKNSKAETFSLNDVQELLDKNYPHWSIAQRFQVSESTITKFISENKLKRSFDYVYGGVPVNPKTNPYF